MGDEENSGAREAPKNRARGEERAPDPGFSPAATHGLRSDHPRNPGSGNPDVDGGGPGGVLLRLPLHLILEPELAVRESMNEEKMNELMDSLRTVGQLYPIRVKARDGKYEVEDGHRRFLAARELGWSEIDALLSDREGLASEAAKLHATAVHEDFNAAQEADWYAMLVERYNPTEAELCAAVHRSPDYIGERLKLLRGDKEILEALREGKISFGVARVLNRVKEDEYRTLYLHDAIRLGLGTRAVEETVRNHQAQIKAPFAKPQPAEDSATAGAPAPPVMACFLCGGYLDTWNLEQVWIHKQERAAIMADLARKAKGE